MTLGSHLRVKEPELTDICSAAFVITDSVT